MNVIKIFVFGMGVLAILWLGSCALIGVGTVAAVNSINESGVVERAEAASQQRALQHHNDQLNREAAYAAASEEYSSYE